ncbi:MAG TPA: hypothetical protein VLV16_10865 [Gemmatimonadales bacterium]|nr:hypothetical protein [Gemmatimonadales bacterium]
MSITRRELKTVDELRDWIERHTGGVDTPDEHDVPRYAIVRQPPTTGAADWNVVAEHEGNPQTWSAARRHAIRTARLLFDVR